MKLPFLIFSLIVGFNILPASTVKDFYFIKNREIIAFDESSDFRAEWDRVDSLENEAMPKMALKLLEEIYRKAKQEENVPHIVKSLIYQAKILNYVEEDGLIKALKRLEKEVKTASLPTKQILHSVIGDLYSIYYRKNWMKIYRVKTVKGDTSQDILKWDAKKINQKIIESFQASLSTPDSLKRIPITDIASLIAFKEFDYQDISPTIYDFIAYRALKVFSNTKFHFYSFKYFSPFQEFVNISFPKKDSLVLKYQAVLVFQDLIQFHAEKGNEETLIDVDLFRLKFIYKKSKNPNRTQLYIEALQHLLQQFENTPRANYIRYELAQFAQKKAQNLLSNIEEKTQFKKYNDMAIRYIDSIKIYKANKILIEKANFLQNKINKVYLFVKSEAVLLPNEHFPINILTRNLAKIDIEVYAFDYNDYIANGREYHKYGEKFYNKLKTSFDKISSRRVNLETINDFQQYSTDLIYSPLPRGFYILVAKGFSEKGEEKAFQYFPIKVSPVACLRKRGEKEEFLLLDRKTGAERLDKSDFFDFEKLKSKSILYNNEHNMNYIHTYFFTDRAIYRPGQTLYFKAVVMVRQEYKYSVLKEKTVSVSLKDANNQIVSTLKLKSDEFGAVSGRFVLPSNVLNGTMKLVSSRGGSKNIRVEEYKRARFEVEIDDIKAYYKLNDKLKITGRVVSFSGESIDNAKLKYRVFRKAYNSSSNWYHPQVGEKVTEVATGNQTCDDNACFAFQFLAQADSSNKEEEQSYVYQVVVDVTDATGETQTCSKQIRVGTTALLLDMEMPSLLNVNQLDSFKLTTLNLEGKEIKTNVLVELQKEILYKSLKNKRIWAEPVVYIDSEEDWKQKLPNYQYSTKNKKKERRRTIKRVRLNTGESNYWHLKKQLKEGTYRVLLKASDAFGKEVTKVKSFVVFDPKSKKMPCKTENLFEILTKTVKSGQEAEILIGSSFKKVHVLLEIDRKEKSTEKRWLELSNSKKIIKIPITEADQGGVSVHMSFVRENRFYHQSRQIVVPYSSKQLDFTFETFRSKLYAGSGEEEWRIKIKNNKGEGVEAQFLALMYDASLDKFIRHNWKFYNLAHYKQRYKYFADFGLDYEPYPFSYNFSVLRNIEGSNPPLLRPRLNWFNFNSSGNKYLKKKNSRDYCIIASNNRYEKDTSLLDSSIERGKIAIKVLDFGQPIPFSRVELLNTPLVKKEMLTDFEGECLFDSVPEGVYSIRVSYLGYKNTLLKGLRVRSNKIVYQDIVLKARVMRVEHVIVRNSREKHELGESEDEVESKILNEEANREQQRYLENIQYLERVTAADKKTVKMRKDFNETAFFFPQLKSDTLGNLAFTFAVPEHLSKWHFRGLAHTPDLKYGFIDKEIQTRKDLMVQAKVPRFFRMDDQVQLPIKVSNLTKARVSADVDIHFYDPFTGKEITKEIYPNYKVHKVEVEAEQSNVFAVSLKIPKVYRSVLYRLVARAGQFSDGEEQAIPVLSNRILVTESLPLLLRGKGSQTFKFDNFINSYSKGIQHHNYSIEMSANPIWYAIQALPFLAEAPVACSDQVFSGFYSNALALHIANSSPKMKKLFDNWKKIPNSNTLLSHLGGKSSLKSALLEETPWLLDTQGEIEQKQRIGLLFNISQLELSKEQAFSKLKKLQLSSGAWPWFKDMPGDRYITQLILSGMGHLRKLKVLKLKQNTSLKRMISEALLFVDEKIEEDYARLREKYKNSDSLNIVCCTDKTQLFYLYMRSFFNDIIPMSETSREAINYYTNNSRKFWRTYNPYLQAIIALVSIRQKEKNSDDYVEKQIVAFLKEIYKIEEKGLFWENNKSYFWYESPTEQQALMIELFSEYGGETALLDDLKTVLLMQKRNQAWENSRVTADAIYALLIQGFNFDLNTERIQIAFSGQEDKPLGDTLEESLTAYLRSSWNADDIHEKMGELTLTKKGDLLTWGAVYWQYFQDLDKIDAHNTSLHIDKKLFVEKQTSNGFELISVDKTKVKVGDKLIVRLVLKVDKDMSYVHLKDMRASAFEPLQVKSVFRRREELSYYESIKDASANFFFKSIKKGIYTFEYPLRAVLKGHFSGGITHAQSMYNPEITTHSQGYTIEVNGED